MPTRGQQIAKAKRLVSLTMGEVVGQAESLRGLVMPCVCRVATEATTF